MYLDHFGFEKSPFDMTPDDNFLYLSKQHSRALVYMDYAAWKPEGFVVITGEIGAGKTTLAKKLLKKFNGKARCFNLAFTNLDGNNLLHYLLRQANIVPKKDHKISLIYAFQEFLKRASNDGLPNVLIIDEAQNLTKETMEDVRMLAALEGSSGPLLRIILLAQPEFINMVNQSEQFRQRVKLHYHLNGISLEDVKSYIEFRMSCAGIDENTLFTDDLIELIYSHSKGIPRVINKMCDGLLMCAYAEERKELSKSDIKVILKDLMIDQPEGTPMLTTEDDSSDVQSQNSPLNKAGLDAGMGLLSRLVTAVESISVSLEKISSKK